MVHLPFSIRPWNAFRIFFYIIDKNVNLFGCFCCCKAQWLAWLWCQEHEKLFLHAGHHLTVLVHCETHNNRMRYDKVLFCVFFMSKKNRDLVVLLCNTAGCVVACLNNCSYVKGTLLSVSSRQRSCSFLLKMNILCYAL